MTAIYEGGRDAKIQRAKPITGRSASRSRDFRQPPTTVDFDDAEPASDPEPEADAEAPRRASCSDRLRTPLAPIRSKDDLTAEQQANLGKVQAAFESADNLHKLLEPRWSTFYGLSRNWRRWGNRLSAGEHPERPRHRHRRKSSGSGGQPLFIPYGFAVIETNVPRILSPRHPRYSGASGPTLRTGPGNASPAEAQFEQDGRRNGTSSGGPTGNGAIRPALRPRGPEVLLAAQMPQWPGPSKRSGSADGRKVVDKEIVVYEGPQARVGRHLRLLLGSGRPATLESARYVIHRTWRDFTYVEQMVADGKERRAKGDPHG